MFCAPGLLSSACVEHFGAFLLHAGGVVSTLRCRFSPLHMVLAWTINIQYVACQHSFSGSGSAVFFNAVQQL
jgi:hypothetical protein